MSSSLRCLIYTGYRDVYKRYFSSSDSLCMCHVNIVIVRFLHLLENSQSFFNILFYTKIHHVLLKVSLKLIKLRQHNQFGLFMHSIITKIIVTSRTVYIKIIIACRKQMGFYQLCDFSFIICNNLSY